MSVCVGEEFIPISEQASNKEKPDMKVDNSSLRTNVFQEEWCVGKNSEGQGVASIEENDLSSGVDHNADDIVKDESVSHAPQQENLSARKVKEYVVLKKKMIKWLSKRVILTSEKKQQFYGEEEKLLEIILVTLIYR